MRFHLIVMKKSTKEVKNKFLDSIKSVWWLSESFIDVIDFDVERFVYPIRERNYESALARSVSIISKIQNLRLDGTSSEYEYGDVQICFRKAYDFACDYAFRFQGFNEKQHNQKKLLV